MTFFVLENHFSLGYRSLQVEPKMFRLYIERSQRQGLNWFDGSLIFVAIYGTTLARQRLYDMMMPYLGPRQTGIFMSLFLIKCC